MTQEQDGLRRELTKEQELIQTDRNQIKQLQAQQKEANKVNEDKLTGFQSSLEMMESKIVKLAERNAATSAQTPARITRRKVTLAPATGVQMSL